MATISSDNGSGVIAVAEDQALLGDRSAARGQRRWRRQQVSGGNSGTVVAATVAASTNSGNNGSGAMAVALERALLGDWAAV